MLLCPDVPSSTLFQLFLLFIYIGFSLLLVCKFDNEIIMILFLLSSLVLYQKSFLYGVHQVLEKSSFLYTNQWQH